jgi:predicted transcriptional regulator
MVFSGYKNKEIAERMEMSDTTVSQIVRSPLGQAYLEGLQDKAQESTLDVRKKLVSLNSSALTVLERIMNPAEKAPHSVQLTAAKDVLDRTGYKAPDRLHIDMTMQTKTDQEIDAEISAMQQSINKTYMQDPIKVSSSDKTQQPELNSPDESSAFTDEQPLQEEEQDFFDNQVDDEDMDSSDQLFNSCNGNNEDDQIDLQVNSPSSSIAMSEESISLLSKIPTNIFQNS